jgi:hypothetical protein
MVSRILRFAAGVYENFEGRSKAYERFYDWNTNREWLDNCREYGWDPHKYD